MKKPKKASERNAKPKLDKPPRLKSLQTTKRPKVTSLPAAGIARTPLVEESEVIQRCELVDFGTTNTNLIQQLRLITAYPYILDEPIRLRVTEIVRMGLQVPDIGVQLETVKIVANLQKVNLGVFKQLASDQVQRHLSFDRQDEGKTEKQKVLEAMSDEELELLEKMAEKMGGSIPVGQ